MLLITLSFWHYKGYFLKMQLGIDLFFFFGSFLRGKDAKNSKYARYEACYQGNGTSISRGFFHNSLDLGLFSGEKMPKA